jgi:hypothetical protein
MKQEGLKLKTNFMSVSSLREKDVDILKHEDENEDEITLDMLRALPKREKKVLYK